MSNRPDGRGSKPQLILYDLAELVYPKYTVIWEQAIPELGQRYDIFIKELGIAIEYDGEQHDKFIEHFHKDMQGWQDAVSRDKAKARYSRETGIKQVHVNWDIDVTSWDSKKLKSVIDSVEYPDTDYDYTELVKTTSRSKLKAREYRSNQYKITKELLKEKNK